MTEEELARHDSKTLLQLLLAADARCDALTAERDRLAHVIDNRESHYGISSNGSMWRFWADEARKVADENRAMTAERDRWQQAFAAQSAKLQIALDVGGEAVRVALKGESHE